MKEFFDSISERFKSPFFSTLIISWSFINWNVVMAIFESDSLIHKSGFDNKVSFIQAQIVAQTPNDLFLTPISIALLYQFILMPFVFVGFRDIVFDLSSILKESFLRWISNKKYLYVKIEKLYEYGNEIVKLKEGYSKAIDSENEYKLKYIDVDEKYQASLKVNKDQKLITDKINFTINENCLNGYWLFSISVNKTVTIRDVLFFNNGLVSKRVSSNEHKPYGNIILFKTDENQTKYTFLIKITDKAEETRRLKSLYSIKKFSTLELSTLASPSIRTIEVTGRQNNIFYGAENTERECEMKRVSDDDFSTQMILDYSPSMDEDYNYKP